jgi:hypothetical protein
MINHRQSIRSITQYGAIATIGKERFLISNISSEGIGVVVEGPDTFFLGQRIEAIQFPDEIPDMIFKGIVSHTSKTDREYVCGIRFVFSGTGDFTFMESLARKYQEGVQPPVLDSNSDRNDAPK